MKNIEICKGIHTHFRFSCNSLCNVSRWLDAARNRTGFHVFFLAMFASEKRVDHETES